MNISRNHMKISWKRIKTEKLFPKTEVPEK